MASWRSRHSPKGRDSSSGVGEGGTSDSDMEHTGLQSKRLKFLSRSRSRSSSPCSSSSPRTPGSWDSSPRAPAAASSGSDSYWGFSSPKAFNLSKSFGRRLGFRRSSNSSSGSSSNSGTTSSSNSGPAEKPLGHDNNWDGSGQGDYEQRTMTLEKLPNDEEEREDYMTVVVGERSGRREKYVINKHLLSHHLFQTMMKCSEEMVGSPEFQSRALLFCDPALFLHLVDVVGADLALDQA